MHYSRQAIRSNVAGKEQVNYSIKKYLHPVRDVPFFFLGGGGGGGAGFWVTPSFFLLQEKKTRIFFPGYFFC